VVDLTPGIALIRQELVYPVVKLFLVLYIEENTVLMAPVPAM